MRRLPLGYILLTALVTLAVTVGVLSIFNAGQGDRQPEQIVITVPIVITTTPNPNPPPQVIIVTATPGIGTPAIVALPTGLLEAAGANAATRAAAPTLDPTILSIGGDLLTTVTALPPDCILYTVAEGDTVFGIADQLGSSGFDMLTVNGLSDDTLLDIGQVLIVPLAGCTLVAQAQQATEAVALTPTLTPSRTGTPPTATFTPSTSPTPSVIPSATLTPSATLPPTALNAQVRITNVTSPGVITSEEISILNEGALIDLSGWTLQVDADTVFTFPEQRLFQGGLVRIFTRTGDNTPVALFWDRDSAALSTGKVVALIDSDGRVQSSYRVP